jgi:hypothetical protein
MGTIPIGKAARVRTATKGDVALPLCCLGSQTRALSSKLDSTILQTEAVSPDAITSGLAEQMGQTGRRELREDLQQTDTSVKVARKTASLAEPWSIERTERANGCALLPFELWFLLTHPDGLDLLRT